MSAHPAPLGQDPPPHDAAASRWGVRLRELAEREEAARLEPIDWQPKPTLWARVRRGAAVPAAAAAVVFLAIVIVSITMVWLQPHSSAAVPAEMSAAAQAADASGGARASLASGGDAGGDVGRDADGADGGSGGSLLGEGAGSARADTTGGVLVVHVVGEVTQPGVYELAVGARVLTAIEAAGGATERAVLSAVNLARPVSDGEQIVVPNAEQIEASGGAALSGGAAALGGAVAAPHSGLVNLNSADAAELETLPRVGPALAQRILAWRDANGGFQSIDQLTSVSGIGAKTFEQLQDLVTV